MSDKPQYEVSLVEGEPLVSDPSIVRHVGTLCVRDALSNKVNLSLTAAINDSDVKSRNFIKITFLNTTHSIPHLR